MRTSIQILVALFISVSFSFAGKYESAMTSAIQKLNEARDVTAYIDAASTFERIGDAEKDKWLPYYYAGLGYIWSANKVQDGNKVDECLDKAQVFLDKAEKLSSNNQEIVILQGYIYMMKVVVDPATRGQQYSGMAMQEFEKAMGMNSDNPRAVLMYGRMKMGTDQFFGNDISESCGMIQKATQMFEKQKTTSEIAPSWGKEMAILFAKACESK